MNDFYCEEALSGNTIGRSVEAIHYRERYRIQPEHVIAVRNGGQSERTRYGFVAL
jgi:hypothetical protein